MRIVKHLKVPTGDILIVEGERGKLEMLSLGDYGKAVNLKADFMGLHREPSPVRHTELLPLEEKWVITISTQYGCSMGCRFCDVPKVGPGKNATLSDLMWQFHTARDLHPEVQKGRINLHFARMGEPTWNPSVLTASWLMHEQLHHHFEFHPVVSTMMPRKNKYLESFLKAWMWTKNDLLGGDAGLQISINSTDEAERSKMFSGNSCTFLEMSHVLAYFKPRGRKITLNFAVADYQINPDVLTTWFSPEHYLVKLTPMHKTHTALANGIETEGDYTTYFPYEEHEYRLKSAVYDVLVFIASVEEDMGRITCGNAILSGSVQEVPFEVRKYHTINHITPQT